MNETETRIMRVQGIPVRAFDGVFTLPTAPPAGRPCMETEPDWPDGSGGSVVCDLPRHETGPDGLAHIATNAGYPVGDIIAIWWNMPARPSDTDLD